MSDLQRYPINFHLKITIRKIKKCVILKFKICSKEEPELYKNSVQGTVGNGTCQSKNLEGHFKLRAKSPLSITISDLSGFPRCLNSLEKGNLTR